MRYIFSSSFHFLLLFDKGAFNYMEEGRDPIEKTISPGFLKKYFIYLHTSNILQNEKEK
jgi:hypothetical protein